MKANIYRLLLLAISFILITLSSATQAQQTEATTFELEGQSFSHHTVEVNGIRLHYVMGGQGTPVFLVHGFLETWYHWRLIMPQLAEQYTVVAVDMRGYGDSDKPMEGYDQATIAEDLYQLAQTLGYERVIVVGHDMGAPPAYTYAARHRDSVIGLGYLEEPVPGFTLDQLTAHTAPEGGAWWFGFNFVPDLPEALIAGNEREFLSYFYHRFSYNPTAVDSDAIDEYLRTFAGPGGVRGALGVYRAIFESAEQVRQDAQTPLTIPVLAIGGSASSGDTVAQGVQNLASDVRGTVIEQCGHFLAEECPDALLEQLLPYLNEVNSE